jgi:hypothetical protein
MATKQENIDMPGGTQIVVRSVFAGAPFRALACEQQLARREALDIARILRAFREWTRDE